MDRYEERQLNIESFGVEGVHAKFVWMTEHSIKRCIKNSDGSAGNCREQRWIRVSRICDYTVQWLGVRERVKFSEL